MATRNFIVTIDYDNQFRFTNPHDAVAFMEYVHCNYIPKSWKESLKPNLTFEDVFEDVEEPVDVTELAPEIETLDDLKETVEGVAE